MYVPTAVIELHHFFKNRRQGLITSKMLAKCFCIAFVLSTVCCVKGDFEDFFNHSNDNQPFSEIPCTVIGGTCARAMECPKGTQVKSKGRCPIQQENGVECCTPCS